MLWAFDIGQWPKNSTLGHVRSSFSVRVRFSFGSFFFDKNIRIVVGIYIVEHKEWW